MRHLFIATATMVALLATGAFPDRAGAADVVPSPYGPPPAYGPQSGYGPRDDYGPPPGYGQPPAYSSPSPRYGSPDDYGPPPGYGQPPAYGSPSPRYGSSDDYGPPPRPPHAIPYAVSPRSYAVRPAPSCDMQWRCGPWACGWRRVCYPEHYARPYRGYPPPQGPGYYGPY